jgi:ferredoxin
MTNRGHKVHLDVDPTACTGLGMCAVVAPGLIELDEWGFPLLPKESLADAPARTAARAVRACPRRALSLREAD